MPAHWTVKGTADFNGDGRTDIAWQATGPDAPPDEAQRVRLWLAQPGDGFEFTEVEVTLDGAPMLLDPAFFEVSTR
jgi:hypothetical protein